jgi:bacillithiol system protein YtxJ
MHMLVDEDALREALASDVAILYKHSPVCPVSLRAIEEVRRFAERQPAVPVYVVDVVRHRKLAQQLARDLGVRHESPQVIVLRKGGASQHASHRGVTAHTLEAWVT